MSAAGGLGRGAAESSWLRQMNRNARDTLSTLLRPPCRRVAWPSTTRLVLAAVLAVIAVVLSMVLLDSWATTAVRHLPLRLIAAADRFTDLGKSGYFLVPLGLVLLGLAAFDMPATPRFARHVLSAWAVRLGFVFIAIAVPSLFVTIVKRLIGRARPSVLGTDVWTYHPFSWEPAYASLPSGHATTAFAALVAIGTILPQARALMWIYAVLIALSRVVVEAHHPSDVIAAAVVGSVGALLVRRWFAARKLGFAVASDGSIKAMPGPSWRRIVKAVARRPQSA